MHSCGSGLKLVLPYKKQRLKKLRNTQAAVDYESLLPVFVEGGYTGYMSSEWEGHMWSDAGGLENVQHHHELCRRILGNMQFSA